MLWDPQVPHLQCESLPVRGSYLNVGNIVHGNFKVHANGPNFAPNVRTWLAQRDFGSQRELGSACEALDRPSNLVFRLSKLGQLSCGIFTNIATDRHGILRHRKANDDVGTVVAIGHVGPDFQHDLNLGGRKLFDDGKDAKGGPELSSNAVVDHGEFSIRGSEDQYSVSLEFVQLDGFPLGRL